MATAAAAITTAPLGASLVLSRLSKPAFLLSASRWIVEFYTQPVPISRPLLSAASAAPPPPPPSLAFGLPFSLPSLLADMWEGLLRAAVPKKKTSYSKTRSRQLAGKALEDVTALVRCPACGEMKRAHRLCPACMSKIHAEWTRANPSGMFLPNVGRKGPGPWRQ